MNARWILIIGVVYLGFMIAKQVGKTNIELQKLDQRTPASNQIVGAVTAEMDAAIYEAVQIQTEIVPTFNKLLLDAQTTGLEPIRRGRQKDLSELENGFSKARAKFQFAADRASEALPQESEPNRQRFLASKAESWKAYAETVDHNVRIARVIFDETTTSSDEIREKLVALGALRDASKRKGDAAEAAAAAIGATVRK